MRKAHRVRGVAASPRFDWSAVDVEFQTSAPEWEGEVETVTLEDVRHAILGVLRPGGSIVLRLFSDRGALLHSIDIASGTVDRGKARLQASPTLIITVERRGDCGCGSV